MARSVLWFIITAYASWFTGNIYGNTKPVSSSSSAKKISSGDHHTCAVLADATVWCWGQNNKGQLGDGTTTRRTRPVKVLGLKGIADVSAGGRHSCAVDVAGKTYCWGAGSKGQLGNSRATDSFVPKPIANLMQVTSISAGAKHTCAVDKVGDVWCWGDNSNGELGKVDDTGPKLVPKYVALPTEDNIEVSTSGVSSHTCARTTDGKAYCWGKNTYGQLGRGTRIDKAIPKAVSFSTPFLEVSAGGRWFSCGIDANSRGKCWGSNYMGQLGNGSQDGINRYATTPTSVAGGHQFKQISVGGHHACGLNQLGVAYCWGYNGNGSLGNGTYGDGGKNAISKTPTKVATDLKFTAISSGGKHSCGITSDGYVLCWGFGRFGQLGDGFTRDVETTPITVFFN